MNEHLKERIARALDDLPDERGYQVIDYIDFLGSKYAERANPDNVFTKITDKVQDVMRAGKVPLDAIAGTVGLFDGASKVMRGLASAAQTVVDEASRTAQNLASTKDTARPDQQTPPAAPPPPDTTPPTDTGIGS